MQNIALNIVLNGVPQAISNLQQFEEVLNAARNQLAQLEIGSQSFKKLSSEIKTADNTLRELKKQTEGKDLEGRLGDFGKLGGAIGSSFAAATAAIQLFGNNSEDSLAAVTTAQNALTVALAARGVAEGAVVVKTVANDIATKALAASTAATNNVTKTFYATLAANPYTAILTAVGLLITAFVAFTDTTEDATKAQKEFQDSLNKDIAKEITNLTVLAERVTNVNLTLETRKKAIEELRAIAPNYFKDLTDEQILQSNLKKAVDDVTEALIKQSTARALQTRVEETATKILVAEDKVLKAKQAQIAAQNNLNAVSRNSIALGQGAGVALANAATQSTVATNNLNEATKELNDLNTKRRNDLNRIREIEGDVDRVLGGEVEKEKDKTKEKEKQVITNTKLLAQEKQLSKIIENLKAALSFESVSEQTISKEQEKILAGLEAIGQTLKSVAPDISAEFEKILNPKVQIAADPFKEIVDKTGLFLNLLKEVPVEFGDIMKIFKEQNLTGDINVFTQEQRQDLVLYFNTLKTAASAIKPALESINSELRITEEEVFQIFASQLTKREEINQRVKNGEITAAKARLDLEAALLQELGKKLGIDQKVLEGLKQSNENQTETFNTELKRLGVTETLVKTILDGVGALVNFTAEVDKQGAIIQSNNDKIIQQVQSIKSLINSLSPEQVGKLFGQLGFDLQKALTFTVTNAEKFGADVTSNLLKGVASMDPELEKLSIKQLKNFKNTVKIAGMELESLGIDVEEIFDKTLTAVDKTIKEKLIDNIISGIQQFQAVLNVLSQTSAQYFGAQFDTLEKRYKRIQEGIVGDSVEANKKRIEAEKAYQAQRAKLEKQQAKTSLRISLAQSAANTAEAITKAFAAYGGTPASFVAAAAIAALSAVQTGIIAQQLANVDSYRRGGVIKKKQGGGFVQGPAHEYGGVRFQGGGIELEGNESVINRVSTVNYMGLLDQINQAGGGRPIYPNFDDSRIVEAIAKQRNTPIRAYVVESDITAKQETARRLERLSQI